MAVVKVIVVFVVVLSKLHMITFSSFKHFFLFFFFFNRYFSQSPHKFCVNVTLCYEYAQGKIFVFTFPSLAQNALQEWGKELFHKTYSPSRTACEYDEKWIPELQFPLPSRQLKPIIPGLEKTQSPPWHQTTKTSCLRHKQIFVRDTRTISRNGLILLAVRKRFEIARQNTLYSKVKKVRVKFAF